MRMKTLTKKVCFCVLTLLFTVCAVFFSAAVLNKNTAKADVAALETEFTNNGQFAVKNTAWGGTHTFVDGVTGATGAVLKTTNIAAGTAGFRLDFTDSGIQASSVESITVRIKVENFTLGTDEFRTSKASGSDFVNYGKTDNLSNWFTYTLKSGTMTQLTNNDGTLGFTDIVIRAYTSGLILYVDSVTVNISASALYEQEFTNNYYFNITKSAWNNTLSYIDGTTVGGTGAALEVGLSSGVNAFRLDFTGKNVLASYVDRIVVRVKAVNFALGTDEFKTSRLVGADWIDYGKTDDLNDWHDYTLKASTMAQLTNDDGTLGYTDIAIRVKSGNAVVMYIDSITIYRSYKTEFIGDNLFDIKTPAWGNSLTYIDGATVGGTGAVLQLGLSAGTAAFRLDFTGSGITAANVESITVRIKAVNFTKGTDEFKTTNNNGASFVEYGKADDLTNWHDYTLNAATMAQLTNNDGTLGYTDILIRAFTANLTAYVDSITVVLAEGADLEAEFTNHAQFAIKTSPWYNEFTYIDGTSIGGDGAVLQVNHSAGTAAFRLDFTDKDILAEDVISIVVRIKADNFTLGTDEFKTGKLTGADWVNYGKTDDLSDWFDYTLNAATMAQLTNNDGTLGYTDLAIRTNTADLVMYVDSITITFVQRPTVVCQGIANDVNNNVQEGTKYRTLLKYDKNLKSSAASDATNVVSTTGQGILLSGVALSEISGVTVNYGHGKTYIQILIPQAYQDAIEGEITLEVIEGTAFEEQILDHSKFILRNGQWAPYKEPEPMSFKAIIWNNYGSDVFEGKRGLLLSFSEYLSNVPNEYNGLFRQTNMVEEEVGGKVRLDGVALNSIDGAEITYFGTTLLWIYVPNMSSYKELTIEPVEFYVSILPATRLAFYGKEWAESYKITHTINGESMVTYCKKTDTTLLGADYYADMFSDSDVSVKLVYFEIGGTTYSSDQTVKVTGDTVVTAKVVGLETSAGASIRLSNPSGIRYETKVDKDTYDYLVSVYGEDNVETGTYIVPRFYFGITSFKDYLADSNKKDGTDYVKIVNEGFYNEATAESDGYYKYYGSLVNLLSKNYCTTFFGIGYIKITSDLDEYIIYGGSDVSAYSRTIYNVSGRAYNDFGSESREKEVLKGFLDGVVPIVGGTSVAIENVIDGYTSPYSVTYNGVTGEYTVSGSAEIKSVLIGGGKKTDGANLIHLNENAYKVTNYTVNSGAASSTVRFKLTSTTKASDLVDFTIEIPSDREMRILQITDTQIIDSSQMRSSDRLPASMAKDWSPANVDKLCFNYVTELIESEQPDLILVTGDIIYGEFDDNGTIWTRIVDFLDSFGIPWAPIFGNHDNESVKGVDWQCAQLEAAENCLFKRGDLSGNGNYSIGLTDSTGKIKRVIYMMDTKGCIGAVETTGIAQDQINWFKGISTAIGNAYGEEVPAFACYHIASSDFRTAYTSKYGYAEIDENFNLDLTGVDGDFGRKNENVCDFGYSIASDLLAANVDGVFIGHDHLNNYSILYGGIRYTYGLKTGAYDMYNPETLGGTLISVTANGQFDVSHKYLNQQEMKDRKSSSLTVTIMSDVHVDGKDYGDFHCTESVDKVRQIMSETKGSRFYISLGDVVNSLPNGSLNNYYDAVSVMKEAGLNIYNTEGKGYIDGNRMMYNLVGNHEAAYVEKSVLKDYIPYVEGVGSVAVFKYEDLMFVAVDTVFDRNGSDAPSDILTPSGACEEFGIPQEEIDWLSTEVANQMDSSVKGIVWISHVALKDLDESKDLLLAELKSYGLPMTVFEGHTHSEAYSELTDDITGEVYCQVYTLPATTLFDNYPYYNVTFKDGKVWNLDKHNDLLP